DLRPEGPRGELRRVGVHHLAPPLRGGGSGPDRLARRRRDRSRPVPIHTQRDRRLGAGGPVERADRARPQRQDFHRPHRQLQQRIPVHLERGAGAGELRERLAQGEADPHQDRDQTRQHLTAQAEQELLAASQQYLINYRKLTPIVYTKVVDSGVQLTIRYLIEPRKRRGTEHAIWEDILTEFATCPDIDLAYHTVRGFKNTDEGKPALRAPLGAPRTSALERVDE